MRSSLPSPLMSAAIIAGAPEKLPNPLPLWKVLLPSPNNSARCVGGGNAISLHVHYVGLAVAVEIPIRDSANAIVGRANDGVHLERSGSVVNPEGNTDSGANQIDHAVAVKVGWNQGVRRLRKNGRRSRNDSRCRRMYFDQAVAGSRVSAARRRVRYRNVSRSRVCD